MQVPQAARHVLLGHPQQRDRRAAQSVQAELTQLAAQYVLPAQRDTTAPRVQQVQACNVRLELLHQRVPKSAPPAQLAAINPHQVQFPACHARQGPHNPVKEQPPARHVNPGHHNPVLEQLPANHARLGHRSPILAQ